jgi:hypothetical protein
MKRYTEAERKQFISQFHLSGLSALAFCRLHGISTPTLSAWRRRFEGLSSPSPATLNLAPAPWVPVVLGTQTPTPYQNGSLDAPHYRLIAPAASLAVPRGFDAGEVAALWQMISPNAGAEVAS